VTCGLLHADKNGRDSLVYDLMEVHRPNVDRLVLTLLQQTVLLAGDLTHASDGSCRLHPQFARYVVARCRFEQETINQGACWLKQQALTASLAAGEADAVMEQQLDASPYIDKLFFIMS